MRTQSRYMILSVECMHQMEKKNASSNDNGIKKDEIKLCNILIGPISDIGSESGYNNVLFPSLFLHEL